ncbi:ATP-binding cassette domain-containing protein [Tsuneonella suprasediminis]|uniref:ATP-binding cassette domain-containing protein n=1 Tax=Tsuneonella suprasediminis TaxID=2306996 RepID=UPI002F943C9E
MIRATARFILIADTVGAAAFALALALAVTALVQATGSQAPVVWVVPLLIISGLLRAVALGGSGVAATEGARISIVALRGRLFPHLLSGRVTTPLSPGAAASVAVDNVEAIRMREIRFDPVRFAAVAGPLLVLVLTACASLVAAGILLSTFVFFILTMIVTGSAAAKESDAQLAALSTLSGLLEDRLRHLPIIRHFGAEERITRQIGVSSRSLSDRTVAVLRKAFLSSAALEFFAALAVALVAVYCGFSLLGLLPFPDPEHLTLGEAFFALALAPEFYLPMRRLAASYHEKQMGEAADRIVDPLLADAGLPSVATTWFTGLCARDLEVRFGERVIGPVDFDLGETGIAVLAGPTGSGKSTILAAIAGQVVPSSGQVVVPQGGLPPDPINIAWAAQSPLILPGTLAENIGLARPDATSGTIREVAERVGLNAVIARRGIDVMLDASGAGLSGGERRRIGIARAIVSGRPLILFDEPTADLDRVAAEEIAALLKQLATVSALVISTHDPHVMSLTENVVRL